MKLLKAYMSNIILIISVILGGILGIILGPKASVLQPFGDIFLNLIFTLIVPLVFFSVSSSISNMSSIRRLGKIMLTIFIVFASTALLAAIIGVIGAIIINPTKNVDVTPILNLISKSTNEIQSSEKVGALQIIVNTFTVSDFSALISRKNILQIIIFSILFGVSTIMSGEKGRTISEFLNSASKVTMTMIKIIMYYAPIGLGCYFASIIGQLGPQILQGYLKAFILYLIISVIYYFGMFTIYAFISGGKSKVKLFWKNAITPSLTALATCSSAACIPINLEYVKKMEVSEDIAETAIPLGANIHKDGSVIGGVIKITFVLGLLGRDITSLHSIILIIVISFLVGAVMAAIPGGGMIGEMLIISVYGFSPAVLPIIAVISTIIDAPATLLNSAGNTVSAMMINRFVEGKKRHQA